MNYIHTEVIDEVGTITLQRDERRNAFDGEVKSEVAEAIRDMKRDDDVHVIVFKSDGKMFSAGGDLKEGAEREPHSLRMVAEDWIEMYDEMRRCPKPIVTRVHGDAFAGGADFLLNSDFAVAAADATFHFTEVELDIIDWEALTMLPRVAGVKKAFEIFMLGEPFSAEVAEDAGIITRSVPAEELDTEIESITSRLKEIDPRILKLAKESIYEGIDMSPTAARYHILSKELELAEDQPDDRRMGRERRL